MNKSNKLEIIGVLSLSLLICSAFAVSSCVPEMVKDFPDQSRSTLELLMSAVSRWLPAPVWIELCILSICQRICDLADLSLLCSVSHNF